MIQQVRSYQSAELYNEAQRRSQLPQPVIKHRRPKSLLLTAPNNVIFELFNTVVREIPSARLTEFIEQNLCDYLFTNWSNKLMQQLMRRLKREQALDVRAGLTSVPVIKFCTGARTGRSPTTVIDARRPSSPNNPAAPQQQQQQLAGGKPNLGTEQPASELAAAHQPQAQHQGLQLNLPTGSRLSVGGRPIIRSTSDNKRTTESGLLSPTAARKRHAIVRRVYEHIMWRIKTNNVTQATSILIKLALDDGYRTGKLKSEPYDDVGPCFEDWRGAKLIKIYAFGSAPPEDQRLVLSSTKAGDLTRWVANFIDGSEKRQKSELISVLAAALRDRTKNCIFITNELVDAVRSLETGAIRCVFLVDRQERYEPITSMPNFSTQIEPLISSGRLFVMSSLACVEFAPDPSTATCC